MIISSLSNQLIKDIVSLKQKKYRDLTDTFVFESGKMFEEAVKEQIKIIYLFYTEKWQNNASLNQQKAFSYCKKIGTQFICVSEDVMKKLSTQKQPDGICCVAKKMRNPHSLSKKYIVFEDVQDPGNVGTIIRTADAAGFDGCISSVKTADIYNEKVLRGSMGSVFHLNFYKSQNLINTILDLKKKDFFIIGSALDGKTTPNFHFLNNHKIALILGNESKGMSNELKSLCDFLVCIPMFGRAESLNVSIAAGILMYDIARTIE